ncbi:hypothetical protein DXG01_009968 [Tephrocybe rancida]|nr:hypothetical protein DXG01_009968 [Tephrocybe rancida]
MSFLTKTPPVLPVIDENLLLSDAIEFNWQNNPTQPFHTFADPEHNPQVITHLEFGRAAHRVAQLLRPPSTGRDGEAVAIIAHTDAILYQVIVAGLIVAGLVPLPISPRLPPEAVSSLLIKTSCHRVIATSTLKSLIEETQAHLAKFSHEVEIREIPSLDAAYPQLAHEDARYPFQPYPILRRPSVSEICIIMHSSGSTGPPKPIPQTHLACTQLIVLSKEWKEHSPRLLIGGMAIAGFNPFSIALQLFHPAFTVVPIALFPPTSASGGAPVTPTPQAIIEHAKSTGANALVVVPPFIEAWSKSPEIVDYLKSLEFVAYVGLQLIPKIGNQLASAGVRVQSIYGGTEFGLTVSTLPSEDRMDWDYVRFLDEVNVRWVPQGDGIFELHLLASQTYRPGVLNLPDVEGLATSDIFKGHPTKEGLWKNVGRLTEIIVHSSGEKTVPRPIEDIIVSDALVNAVILFGEGQKRAGALIEVRPDTQIDVNDQVAVSRLRDQVWPIIEEANNDIPASNKIIKETILFTSQGKPLPRTGKFTVLRQAALELYTTDILKV